MKIYAYWCTYCKVYNLVNVHCPVAIISELSGEETKGGGRAYITVSTSTNGRVNFTSKLSPQVKISVYTFAIFIAFNKQFLLNVKLNFRGNVKQKILFPYIRNDKRIGSLGESDARPETSKKHVHR
jgi:hypothetical protein